LLELLLYTLRVVVSGFIEDGAGILVVLGELRFLRFDHLNFFLFFIFFFLALLLPLSLWILLLRPLVMVTLATQTLVRDAMSFPVVTSNIRKAT
jgi:hypothetical protein